MHRLLVWLFLCSLLTGCSEQRPNQSASPTPDDHAAPAVESRPLRRAATTPVAGYQDNGLIGSGTAVEESLAPPPVSAPAHAGDPFKALPASVDKTPIRADGIGLSSGAASPGNP